MNIGFIGIGRMGQPIARRLLQAGRTLTVWSRSAASAESLAADGAEVAATAAEVFVRCPVVLLMLRDEAAADAVLERRTKAFAEHVAGRLLIQMGTVAPAWSRQLAQDITTAGGHYVEAPVSGSRIPAERGQLLGMLAGDPLLLPQVEALLAPACHQFLRCGPVPGAMQLKLAVNHYLIGIVCVLAETVRAAEHIGLPLPLLQHALQLSPMASSVLTQKLDVLASGSHQAQASILDVSHVCELVLAQALGASADSPIMAQCLRWFQQACARGDGNLDMAAVLRTDQSASPTTNQNEAT